MSRFVLLETTAINLDCIQWAEYKAHPCPVLVIQMEGFKHTYTKDSATRVWNEIKSYDEEKRHAASRFETRIPGAPDGGGAASDRPGPGGQAAEQGSARSP